MDKKVTVGFDCDLTLVDADNKPIPRNVGLLQCFINMGADVIVWSLAGIEHATETAEKIGVKGQVRIIAKGSEKVDLSVDDQDTSLGRVNFRVGKDPE